MAKQKPPASPNGLIIRSTPFTGDGRRRLVEYQQQEEADRRGRAELVARGRWIGATGRRPRARRSEAVNAATQFAELESAEKEGDS